MSMNTLPPHLIFQQFIGIIDELRTRSVKQSSEAHRRKLLGLTLRQGNALAKVKILTAKEPNGISLKVLANHMQMTVPAASLLVDDMVKASFFERTANPNDRRAVLIRLSSKGMKLFLEIFQNLNNHFDQVAEVLNDEELTLFSKLTEKLYKRTFE